jgi:hypothetical protein
VGFERHSLPSRAEILKLAQEVVDYRIRFTPAIALDLARFILIEEREREADEKKAAAT